MSEVAREVGVALVAGGTGAIGREVIRRLETDGWRVVATYKSIEPVAAGREEWHQFDGTEESCGRLTAALGQGPLGCVVCCIGAPSSKNLVAETRPAEFSDVYAANVGAVVALWNAIASRARLGAAGVVFLGSDTTARLAPGNGAYSAAKAALEALCVTLAKEEAPYSVRFNVVAPSLVESPLADHVMRLKGVVDPAEHYKTLPWGRPLTSVEVASVAVDVATGSQWRYASGQTIRLAGPVPAH